MLKYTETQVTFSEVPDEISLCINLSGCPYKCEGCHSSYLQEDVGEILNESTLKKLIENNEGITCISFMGGDANPKDVLKLLAWIKENYSFKTCWYRGSNLFDMQQNDFKNLDFIKTGVYKKTLGGLNNPNTNQRFYKIEYANDSIEPYYTCNDITYKFWKKNEIKNKN